jgi:hypothetical protein
MPQTDASCACAQADENPGNDEPSGAGLQRAERRRVNAHQRTWCSTRCASDTSGTSQRSSIAAMTSTGTLRALQGDSTYTMRAREPPPPLPRAPPPRERSSFPSSFANDLNSCGLHVSNSELYFAE